MMLINYYDILTIMIYECWLSLHNSTYIALN